MKYLEDNRFLGSCSKGLTQSVLMLVFLLTPNWWKFWICTTYKKTLQRLFEQAVGHSLVTVFVYIIFIEFLSRKTRYLQKFLYYTLLKSSVPSVGSLPVWIIHTVIMGKRHTGWKWQQCKAHSWEIIYTSPMKQWRECRK